jgi:hypothetical protein
MKNILVAASIITLVGCANYQVKSEIPQLDNEPVCLGSSTIPESMASDFVLTDDETLLNKTLGKPQKGKLCQGLVYKSKKNSQIVIYRAWNSTNPNSQFGKWWAFQKPTGEISQYRSGYEICYQWSPLDKLVSCTLKEGTKVVVGTGQSAQCSEYLTYPVSDELQIYIDDASNSLTNCTVFSGEFSWK